LYHEKSGNPDAEHNKESVLSFRSLQKFKGRKMLHLKKALKDSQGIIKTGRT
jgi:hypothetical protein